ncbi:hypothetical protein RSOLAG1IB_08197 [Rhizoctonia solani AG-1 IB]|uniref:Uncharacterized protein n=1 Tax=Thanatephorus cucumeris (strain AG1-IB / isolate 7/3/14) TaxID=1108050 RepID=A0A0B7FJ16_THACB|nr:hypothetical protein RSOLAG1IB_08197 [Rhizoctonia solani AG-1 IB]
MKLFAVMPVLVTLVTKVAGSPSTRLRMLNQRQLQGEGCKLLRRACPAGHVCSGGLLSARCYKTCLSGSDECSKGFRCETGKCVPSN